MVNFLNFSNVSHIFRQGNQIIQVLKNINFSLNKGEIIALLGTSGSGKSTFLQIAGLLESPQQGEVSILGKEVGKLSDKKKTLIRRKHLGFIYQFHYLLEEFSALENVAIAGLVDSISKKEAYKKAEEILNQLGLSHRLFHKPKQLSGGEQQRVAIARSLFHGPEILLADEPTGNLDEKTAYTVFGEIINLVRKKTSSAIIVTHDENLAKKADKVFHLQGGKIQKLPI